MDPMTSGEAAPPPGQQRHRLPWLTEGSWRVDPADSRIEFAVASLPPARGTMAALDGRVELAPEGIAASARVDAASVETGNRVRDRHLRSSHFLNVARHPEIHFATRSVERDGDRLRAHGDVTIRGIVRPLTLVGRLEPAGPGRDAVRAQLAGRLDRRAFRVQLAALDRIAIDPIVELTLDLMLRRDDA